MYFLYIFFCFCISTSSTLISCLFICLSLILRDLNVFVIVFVFCFDVIPLVFYFDSGQTYFRHRAQAIYIICHIFTAYNQLASSLKFIFTTAMEITAVQQNAIIIKQSSNAVDHYISTVLSQYKN